jgi:hypothetical protein
MEASLSAQEAGQAEAPRLVTQEDLDAVAAERREAEPQVHIGNWWIARDAELRAVQEILPQYLGRPVSDIEAALEQAEKNLAEAEADLAEKRGRARDLQGYVRVLKERQAEAAAQPH